MSGRGFKRGGIYWPTDKGEEALARAQGAVIAGRHAPDPERCRFCREQASDGLMARALKALGIDSVRQVEHGEPEAF